MYQALCSILVSSVTQSCSTLCDPMDCSTPGFPVDYQLLKFTQTYVHWVGDAIQPFHPLSSPSPPAFNLSSTRVFSKESVLHIRWPKDWSFSFNICPSNEYSGLISFRIDWFDLLTVQGDLVHYIIIHYKYILKYSLCIYSVQFERLLTVKRNIIQILKSPP